MKENIEVNAIKLFTPVWNKLECLNVTNALAYLLHDSAIYTLKVFFRFERSIRLRIGGTTLSITTLSITTFSIMTLSITTLSIMTLRIKLRTLSIRGLYVAVSIKDTQHNNALPLC